MINGFHDLFIGQESTIKGAMKQMDKAAKKILFVADNNRRLLGTITDGDIRRWILADGDLRETVDKIYNKTPVSIGTDASEEDIKKKMLAVGGQPLPVVDGARKIIKIVSLGDVVGEGDIEKKKKHAHLSIPVVIMAGGQGSRLDPFTKILPKALIPIGDKPAVEVIIDNFLQYISGDVYLILGHKKEMIMSYFNHDNAQYKIHYLFDGEKPLGTIGGLQFLPKDFSDTFFFTNCDTIIQAGYDDLYAFHKNGGYDITIVGSMQHVVMPYGIMKISSGGELKTIEEKPEYDFLVNTGMYVIEKRIVSYIPSGIPFDVPDLLKEIKARGGKIGVYPVSEKSWFDVGQWESYKKTVKNFLGGLEKL